MLEAVCFQTREVLDAVSSAVLTSQARSAFAFLSLRQLTAFFQCSIVACVDDAYMHGQMGKDSGVSLDLLKVDGGMCVNNRLMQIQADLLGVVSFH
jgi:glycerol kinase